ncbi:MAG: patatin-like phospholipase family protein [Dehalococcoidales bacterium]|nr:patatin-like phospholipase family protein [Dehalococcoidales bacterium]
MGYHFRNLVFEGGGVKGIAYIGAMQVLEEKGILPDIQRVGGTSVGAINALLFALGFDNSEQRKILWQLDFNNFLDASWLIPNVIRVLNRYGWYKGDYFRDWIGKLITEKTGSPNATFRELREAKKPDLYIYGTNLSTHFSEVFSIEHSPDMRLADAVRISMSLPLFFTAIRNTRNDVYVDGGLLDSFPVKLFDREKYIVSEKRKTDYYEKQNASFLKEHPDSSPYIYNKETLGFRLDSKEEIAAFRYNEPQVEKIDRFFEYIKAVVKTILESQSNTHLHGDDWQRTIYIDTLGIATTDFSLSDDMKRALEESGRNGASEYFKWFDNPANQPVNRS